MVKSSALSCFADILSLASARGRIVSGMGLARTPIDDLAARAAWDRLRRPVWLFCPVACRGVYANPPALELWGAESLDELLARDFSDLSTAVRTRTDRLRALTANGEEIDESWTFYPRGRPVTVRAAISTVVLTDGRDVLLFEAAPLDVEAEERRAVEALRHSAGPIGLFDGEGTPLFANPAAYAVYGPDTGFLDRFAETAEGQAVLALALAGKETGVLHAMKTQSGIRWHHLDCRPLPDPVTGSVSILLNERDVTDRVEAEAARAAAEQKAAMAEARQRFLTEMSHELRTPLNAVLGFSSLLLKDGLTLAQDSHAARIHAAGEELAAVVEQMIGLSLREEGAAVTDPAIRAQALAAIPNAGPAKDGDGEAALRVLYIDDNDSNRALVSCLLASQGIHCETADDGAQGLAAAARGGWDVVLMDIQMPVMDGIASARCIRALKSVASGVPIIAVTANTLEEQLVSYAAAGMNDCVAKPIRPLELLNKVADWASTGWREEWPGLRTEVAA